MNVSVFLPTKHVTSITYFTNYISVRYNINRSSSRSNIERLKCKMTPRARTTKKNTNSTQNKSQTHRAKQYEVTSFLSTDCELSTDTCSKNVYSLGPQCSNFRSMSLSVYVFGQIKSKNSIFFLKDKKTIIS